MKVMELWMAGGGDGSYRVTWEGVERLLGDVECGEVAREWSRAVAGCVAAADDDDTPHQAKTT